MISCRRLISIRLLVKLSTERYAGITGQYADYDKKYIVLHATCLFNAIRHALKTTYLNKEQDFSMQHVKHGTHSLVGN